VITVSDLFGVRFGSEREEKKLFKLLDVTSMFSVKQHRMEIIIMNISLANVSFSASTSEQPEKIFMLCCCCARVLLSFVSISGD
jgi:hypothetical protein